MGAAAQIKTLLREADLYQQQGLLNEAKERYKKATEILRKNAGIRNSQELIQSIVKKVMVLNQEINKINEAATKPEVSNQKQDLIKNLFGGGKDEGDGQRALEGAIALAKFGQFERALAEFDHLLEDEGLRVAAAKNIIRCYIELSDLDQAVERFSAWVEDTAFKDIDLKKIRFFLETRLRKLGHDGVLPERTQILEIEEIEADDQTVGTEAPSDFIDEVEAESVDFDSELELHEEEFLDINSVGIQLAPGNSKGQMFEFDVSFQTGNSINLIIPNTEKTLLKELKAGTKLHDMQFFSPIAILNGSGVVTSKTRIKSGPKEGDFSLDITILTT